MCMVTKNFYAPNYKEHLKKYFNQKVFFPKKYFCIFLYMNLIKIYENQIEMIISVLLLTLRLCEN